MKRASKITSFFSKKQKTTGSTSDEHTEIVDSASPTAATLHDPGDQIACASASLPSDIPSASGIMYENDIGLHIGTKPSDRVLATILQNHWEPPAEYSFPHSTHNKGGKSEKRFLKKEHLDKYKTWLVLSPSKEGLFCKVCPFFASALKGGYHRGMKLNTLVTTPLTKFSKLLGKDGDLESHSRAAYHQQALGRANDFLVSYQNPKKSVENQIDTYRLKRMKRNRKLLSFSLQNVIFLGRQNISFRGHRDDGSVFSKDPRLLNKGNFKELMKFRAEECGEKELEAQYSSDNKRRTFLSKTVQNELIECCGEEIISQIVERIEENGFYSIGFDETTDISHKTQMSLFIRYVYRDVIREDFIGFINPREPQTNLWKQNIKAGSKSNENEHFSSTSDNENDQLESFHDDCDSSRPKYNKDKVDEDDKDPRMTGIKLGKTVINTMRSLNLDLSKCIGIATDGCSVMSSEIVGAVATIKEECKNAERAPCFNHSLNLSISKCCGVQQVRNSIGIVKEVVSFFTASPKRNAVLVKHTGSQLVSMCETRWVERQLSVVSFLNKIEKIVLSLEEISQWSHFSSDTASVTATTLLYAISNGEFILTLVCLADVLSQTLPLSRFFQKETIDVTEATEIVTDTLSVLKTKRGNAVAEFSQLYDEAKRIADIVGSTIQTPRITSRQINRPNAAQSNPESYFRVNVFIPILDTISNDLKSRFSKNVLILFNLKTLLPKVCSSSTKSMESVINDIEIVARNYYKLLGKDESDCMSNLRAEVKLWVTKWKREDANETSLPSYGVECLQFCTTEIFPSIRSLILILSCLPVSTATAERSFSTLKLIKTWLRNRCGQNRLTGLALLYVHRDIIIEKEKIIDRFIAKGGKKRRCLLSEV